jgi:hypothetical protein
MVTLRRIRRYGDPSPNNEARRDLFVGPGSSRVVIRFRSSHLSLSATGSHQHSFPSRQALATPDIVSGSTDGMSFRGLRDGSGQTVAIEYASVRIVRKPARNLVHRQLDGSQPMIEFPNHSRSYDRTRHAVRFWGHDSAIEASFFINEDALKRIQPDARPNESGFLNAFDSNRDLICAAAARVYVRGSRGSYDLVAANF